MSFEWPLALVALALVPAMLIVYLLVRRRPSRYAVTFTNLDVLASVVDRRGSWRRWVAPVLFLLALAAATAAMARPHLNVQRTREQATIVLAVDESGSMFAQDVQPSRLQAAQAAVNHFLDRLPPKFRVGLVAFAGDAQVAAPVTRDRQLVRDALSYLSPQRGTAIGDAVARAAQLGHDAVGNAGDRRLAAVTSCQATGNKEPVAVLFLSDGFQTAGALTPDQGAAKAKSLCVPVYTIALGTDQGVLDFGVRQIPVPPDRETLRRIAVTT
ncbi:MAG TPA: VWA domain-containing protein, partial [Gaiellaceae bacterium]|nr:VWA domain-containing protein [Gaiellaceae bacterium]